MALELSSHLKFRIYLCVCVHSIYCMNQVVSKLKIKCTVYLDKSKKVQSLALTLLEKTACITSEEEGHQSFYLRWSGGFSAGFCSGLL